MLFKEIVQFYGRYLNGVATPSQDPFADFSPVGKVREFRSEVIEGISKSVPYVLDEMAAEYLDSLREEIQQNTFTREAGSRVSEFMSHVDLPSDVVWVEYDHRKLAESRLRRGHTPDEPIYRTDTFGPRGFLIDNRILPR